MRKIKGNTWQRGMRARPIVFWLPFISVLLLQLLVWILVGGRLHMFRLLRGLVSLLPLWAFTLFDWLCSILLGFFAGRLCLDARVSSKTRYQIGFYLVIAIACGFFWHAIFFGNGIFLLSLLPAIGAMCALYCCLHSAYEQKVCLVWLLVVTSIWYLYRVVFTLFCLFSF